MRAEEKKPEIVYRRTADPLPGSAESGGIASLDRRALVRAITPLIVGFLLLLVFILALGLRSAGEMQNVGTNARELALGYSARLNLLSDLRFRSHQTRQRSTSPGQRGIETRSGVAV